MNLITKILFESKFFEPKKITQRNEEHDKKKELKRFFLNTTILKGDFDFYNYKDLITSLHKVQTIQGNVDFMSCKLLNLGDLKLVQGSLTLLGCEQLTSLSPLEKIEGWIDIRYCWNLEDVSSLQIVTDSIYVSNKLKSNIMKELINKFGSKVKFNIKE